jgi:hypothetical protein
MTSGAKDYELYCSLYELEEVNTRLDTLPEIFLNKNHQRAQQCCMW